MLRISIAIQKILAVVTIAAFVIGFIYAVDYYSSTRARMEKDPLVTNISKDHGLMAKVHFGSSPRCDHIPCAAGLAFDDRKWTEIRLPKQELSSLPGYQDGLQARHVTYRIEVPISAALLAQNLQIAFSPMYIGHGSYEIYVGGRLAHLGNRVGGTAPVEVVSIARSEIIHDTAMIVIDASLEPGDTGLYHRGDFYVGPESALSSLYVHGERALASFFLLFLAAKGGVFVIFALIFLLTRGQVGFAGFLVFSFSSTIQALLIGDFLDHSLALETKAVLVFYLKTAGVLGLFGFFCDYFMLKK